jgi:hypothetical protein
MKRYSLAMSFLIDLNGINNEMNLKTVIEIQNIELYLNAYYFESIFSNTAYEDIQFAKPSSIPI